MVCLVMLGLTPMANYAWYGLTTAQPIAVAVLLRPIYILAMVVGARWFRGSSDAGHRHIAYAIVALAARASMPMFDHLLH